MSVKAWYINDSKKRVEFDSEEEHCMTCRIKDEDGYYSSSYGACCCIHGRGPE